MIIGIGIGIGFSSKPGVSVPGIRITATDVAEDESIAYVVGVLSVANGSGSYTFSITADPDSKFQIANDDELQLADTLDYETATSHSVTIEADNGVDDPISRVFTINVTNVLEVTLNALTLDTDEIEEGSAAATVVGALQDVTSGSTLSLIDDAGGRFALSGENIVAGATATDYESATSHNITVRETIADASNSPRDSVIAITVTLESSAPTVSTFTPADNAASVSVSATSLIITFNESIQFGATASFRLYKTAGDVLVQEWTEADVLILVIDGDQLEMTLDDPLEPGVAYYVQADAGSVEDLADNAYAGIADETTWNFTTESLAPSAFVNADWDLDAGDTEADVTINSLPAANGSSITDIEYRLDGGSWVSSGGTSSFTIGSLTNDQEYDVELRAVNGVGNGVAGDLKSVTPAAAGGATFAEIVATAVGAYSMRKLRSGYSGSPIEVYNESTTGDIGFSGNDLDLSALASFAATNGWISKWYDQSGNGNNLSATGGAIVPLRVSGVTSLKNSLPAPNYVTGVQHLRGASATSVAEIVVVMAISAASTFPDYSAVVASDTDQVGLVGGTGASTWHTGSGATMTTFTRDGAVTSTPLFGGTLQVIGCYGTATNFTKLDVGYWQYGALVGHVCEVLCFPSQLSTDDRATVYANLKAYWGTA